jgi:alpha-tubulin suppressor-like RCC1 family protein
MNRNPFVPFTCVVILCLVCTLAPVAAAASGQVPYAAVAQPVQEVTVAAESTFQATGFALATSPLSNITTAAAGEGHTCALTTTGDVLCWGHNPYGQLGNGTITDRRLAAPVVGLEHRAVGIAAGEQHACAVMSSGRVRCWGSNTYGQLGDDTIMDRYTPVQVKGLASDVIDMAAGTAHTCALTSSGGVLCWGLNGSGELGDGTTTDHHTPVPVLGLGSGVIDIASGNYHTCALTSSGGVWCWGSNISGQLGDGTTTHRSEPVSVLGLATGVAAIGGGQSYTCAAMSPGGARCWGRNSSGQLGDGTKTNRSSPVPVLELANRVTHVAGGEHHTCALKASGGVVCWGWNGYGALGDGTNTDSPTPVQVVGLASGVGAITAGELHSCAVTGAGRMACWGYNSYGQLGDGTETSRRAPADVTSPLETHLPLVLRQ